MQFCRDFDAPNKWLVIFPEGTRAGGKGKLEQGRAFAREKGLKELQYVRSVFCLGLC